MSEYGHDDAMRDLASFPERTRVSMHAPTDRLAAYIESLETDLATEGRVSAWLADACENEADVADGEWGARPDGPYTNATIGRTRPQGVEAWLAAAREATS